MLTKNSFTFRSTSDLSDIYAYSYYPTSDCTVKGIIQIAHGMAEHHERYEDFIQTLNNNGYIVYINDHLGHGKSVENDNELGYFGKEKGYLNLVDDMKLLTASTKTFCCKKTA